MVFVLTHCQYQGLGGKGVSMIVIVDSFCRCRSTTCDNFQLHTVLVLSIRTTNALFATGKKVMSLQFFGV